MFYFLTADPPSLKLWRDKFRGERRDFLDTDSHGFLGHREKAPRRAGTSLRSAEFLRRRLTLINADSFVCLVYLG